MSETAPVLGEEARELLAESLFEEANEHEDGWGGGLPFWEGVADAAIDALAPHVVALVAAAEQRGAEGVLQRLRDIAELMQPSAPGVRKAAAEMSADLRWAADRIESEWSS